MLTNISYIMRLQQIKQKSRQLFRAALPRTYIHTGTFIFPLQALPVSDLLRNGGRVLGMLLYGRIDSATFCRLFLSSSFTLLLSKVPAIIRSTLNMLILSGWTCCISCVRGSRLLSDKEVSDPGKSAITAVDSELLTETDPNRLFSSPTISGHFLRNVCHCTLPFLCPFPASPPFRPSPTPPLPPPLPLPPLPWGCGGITP